MTRRYDEATAKRTCDGLGGIYERSTLSERRPDQRRQIQRVKPLTNDRIPCENYILDICVLSLEEAARLENYGIWPTCKAHLHVRRKKAQEAIEAETHRFVGGPDTKVGFVSAIVATDCTRVWSPVRCHDESGKAIMGLRTWGLQPLR
jgi:hypothetical protein